MPMPWENEGWLPHFESPRRPLQQPVSYPPIAAPWSGNIATPPFVKPPLAPPAPIAAPQPIGALDQMAALEAQRPTRSDPNLQPGKARRILGALAGGAVAAGTGWANAGGRVRLDPNAGAQLADTVINSKYNQATNDFENKRGALAQRAKIEQQKIANEQRAAESKARIGSEQAQQAAAEASAARSKNTQPAQPRPTKVGDALVDESGKVLYQAPPKEADPQNIQQAIAVIRARTDIIGEEQDRMVAKLTGDWRAMHDPDKSLTKLVTDNNGRITGISVRPSQIAAAGGSLPLGSGGKAVVPRAAKSAAPAKAAGTVTRGSTSASSTSATAQGVANGNINYWGLGQKERAAVRNELGPNWAEPPKATAGQIDREGLGAAALEGVSSLKTRLKGSEGDFGPLKGLMANAPGPFGATQKMIRTEIDVMRQRVGKLFEGGVLRKEDEKKYEKIMPLVTDTPTVAAAKLDYVEKNLQSDLRAASGARGRAGKVPQQQPDAPPTTTQPVASGPLKKDQVRMVKGVLSRITTVNPDGSFDAVPVK